MKKLVVLLGILLLYSCYYGVNEKTSWICEFTLDNCSKELLEKVEEEYSIKNIKDSTLLSKVKEFKNQAFPITMILYFKDAPEELIGLEYYGVRYVYNKNIADQILNGLSPQLNENDKERICKRISELFVENKSTNSK